MNFAGLFNFLWFNYSLGKGFLKVGNDLFFAAHDAFKPYFAVLGGDRKSVV